MDFPRHREHSSHKTLLPTASELEWHLKTKCLKSQSENTAKHHGMHPQPVQNTPSEPLVGPHDSFDALTQQKVF